MASKSGKPGKKTAGRKASAKKVVSAKSAAKTAKKAKKASSQKAVAKKSAPKKADAKKAAAKKQAAAKAASASKAGLPRRASGQARVGKTARSRLAARAKHELARPARKIALRTSLTGGAAAPSKPSRAGAAESGQFEPALLIFREAAKRDWPAIRQLLVEAFGRGEESELTERLRAGRDMIRDYVAEHHGKIVGFLGFCGVSAIAAGRGLRAAGLAPVAVAGEFERRGIATRLVVYGLENIRGAGFDAVFVVGSEQFYGRFGFSSRLATRFKTSAGAGHLQAMEFEPGALRGEQGEVSWPAAFDAF